MFFSFAIATDISGIWILHFVQITSYEVLVPITIQYVFLLIFKMVRIL